MRQSAEREESTSNLAADLERRLADVIAKEVRLASCLGSSSRDILCKLRGASLQALLHSPLVESLTFGGCCLQCCMPRSLHKLLTFREYNRRSNATDVTRECKD